MTESVLAAISPLPLVLLDAIVDFGEGGLVGIFYICLGADRTDYYPLQLSVVVARWPVLMHLAVRTIDLCDLKPLTSNLDLVNKSVVEHPARVLVANRPVSDSDTLIINPAFDRFIDGHIDRRQPSFVYYFLERLLADASGFTCRVPSEVSRAHSLILDARADRSFFETLAGLEARCQLAPRLQAGCRSRQRPVLTALRRASGARTAGCRRCGSSRPRPGCRCGRPRRTRPSACRPASARSAPP